MKLLNIIILVLWGTTNLSAQDFSKLYEEVNPTVVVIKVEESQTILDRASQSRISVTSAGLGSGVVISEDGLIMTAAHVIQAVDKLLVEFENGEEVPANVVTLDADADVALIKLVRLPKNLKAAKLGNSDLVKIGQQIMVIGAPLGLSHSLSLGHISGRQISGQMSDDFEYDESFQTDASINHGNSGGPMFNMNGEVVGLVSFILSQSGGFEGIGFAATINVAKKQLLGDQPFWFGIETIPVKGELAKIFNIPQEMGLLVQRVAAGSPSDLAGIKGGSYTINIEGTELLVGGDIVLALDEYTMAPDLNIKEFRLNIANKAPGSTFKVKVLRSRKILELVGVVPEKNKAKTATIINI